MSPVSRALPLRRVINAITPHPSLPFRSSQTFSRVFLVSSFLLLFFSPPLLSIWKTRPEGETTRLCDECNYARRGTKVSWRKYASVPLLFRILDRLSEDLFFGNWSISQQLFLGWNQGGWNREMKENLSRFWYEYFFPVEKKSKNN